jgi:hypothetical protein
LIKNLINRDYLDKLALPKPDSWNYITTPFFSDNATLNAIMKKEILSNIIYYPLEFKIDPYLIFY